MRLWHGCGKIITQSSPAFRLRWVAGRGPRMASDVDRRQDERSSSSASGRAYVGGNADSADEYYDCDFSFEEHKRQIESIGEHLADSAELSSVVSVKPAPPPCPGCWESFHRRDNATAKFYKERRYLLLEFPVLNVQHPPQHFAEIGCGAGSSILPVLKANPSCTVTGTDLSPSAIAMLKEAADCAGIAKERLTAFACDAASLEPLPNPFQGIKADALLLIFTLAALSPAQMPAMLQNAFQALKPGGLLLVRDHGLYDTTHLRLREKQRESHRLYRRSDGTLCYFFSVEDLTAKARAAGFEEVECKYACVSLRNRKRALDMKRVFVHGVFRRPV